MRYQYIAMLVLFFAVSAAIGQILDSAIDWRLGPPEKQLLKVLFA